MEHFGGAENGRVTSIVRFDPGSSFARHPHPEGEEILVLDGVFSDEEGDYPAGSYLLNPEGFAHAPFSKEGCVLFVKLRQYAGARDTRRVNTRDKSLWQPHDLQGVQVCPLYASPDFPEVVYLVRAEAGLTLPYQSFPDGEEIYLLEGRFRDEHGEYRSGSWVRYQSGSGHTPSFEEASTLYVRKSQI
jgi:anti-sigma factor ChrR (cupin superfamily)